MADILVRRAARLALLVATMVVLGLPSAGHALGLGAELAWTTRWQQTRSAAHLGQEGTAGFTLVGSAAIGPKMRAEGLWRSFEESGTGPSKTQAETLEHQVGLGMAGRLVERSWWSVEASGGVGASWRRLELWQWVGSNGSASWRGWSPYLEAGAALELGLPRSMTRDRYALGVRLHLGWQHVFGRGVDLQVSGARPADVVDAPVALGTWSISGPMTRFGFFARF